MPVVIQYGPVNAYNASTPGLSLNNGIITVNFTPLGSGTLQPGQFASIQRCVSIPPYGAVSWFANKAYPAGYIIVSSVSAGVSVFQKALNGGTSGSTIPTFSSTIGTQTVDDQGTGYSSPPITWVCVQPGESWNFNGLFLVNQVLGPGEFTVTAASKFAYFNPGLQAVGGALPLSGYGSGGTPEPLGDVTVFASADPILEVHGIMQPGATPQACGISYQPSVAFQQGVIVVQLTEASPVLTSIWNTLQNANQLENPILSQLFVRLIGCQTYYGVQVPGVYSVAAVLGPPQYALGTAFAVQPLQAQFLPDDVGGGGLAIFLRTLTMGIEPGLLDLSDTALANTTGEVCDDVLWQINHNAKMAAVRTEVFDMGYWIDGQVVPTPTSAVDGYAYSYAECTFDYSFVTSSPVVSGSPYSSAVFVPGEKDFPGLGATDSTLITDPYTVFVDASGNVTCKVYTNQGSVAEGAVRVICTAQREASPLVLPVEQLAQPVPWSV
jgi:hypothetical protein